MSLLWAALVPIGILTLVNLVLGIGIIRRLRAHENILRTGGTPPLQATTVPAGEAPSEFEATAVDGTPVTRDDLTGPALIGFFQPDCAPCAAQTEHFRQRAARMRGSDHHIWTVIAGPNEQKVRSYAEHFDGLGTVVAERPGGPIVQAFGVSGYPTFVLVDANGHLTAAQHTVAELPEVRR